MTSGVGVNRKQAGSSSRVPLHHPAVLSVGRAWNREGRIRVIRLFRANKRRPPPWDAGVRTSTKQRVDDVYVVTGEVAAREDKLVQLLVPGRNVLLDGSVVRNERKQHTESSFWVELPIRAAQMPLQELRAKATELDRHLMLAEQAREDSQALLQSTVALMCVLVEAEAKRFAGAMVEPLRAAIQERMSALSASTRRGQAAEMATFLRERSARLFEDWRIQFEDHATEYFHHATARFAERVSELIAEVRRMAGSLFGFSVQKSDAIDEPAELEPFEGFPNSVLDWGFGNAVLIVPTGLFRRYLLRAVVRKAEAELEQKAAFVSADYNERLSKSLALFLERMTARFNETIDGIGAMLESALTREQTRFAAVRTGRREQETTAAALVEHDGCENDDNRARNSSSARASLLKPCTTAGGSHDV